MNEKVCDSEKCHHTSELCEFKKILHLCPDPLQTTQDYVSFGENGDFMSAFATYLAGCNESVPLPAHLDELCMGLRRCVDEIRRMGNVKRLNLLAGTSMACFVEDLYGPQFKKYPAIRKLASFECFKEPDEDDDYSPGPLDADPVLKMISSALMRKDGAVDSTLLAMAYRRRGVVNQELPELIADLPERDRGVWRCFSRLEDSSDTRALAFIVLENQQRLPALPQSGAMTMEFYSSLTKIPKARVELDSVAGKTELGVSSKSEEHILWLNLPHDLRAFIKESWNSGANLFAGGRITPDLIRAILYENKEYVLRDVADYLQGICTNNLPEPWRVIASTPILSAINFFGTTREYKDKILEALQKKKIIEILSAYNQTLCYITTFRQLITEEINDSPLAREITAALLDPAVINLHGRLNFPSAKGALVSAVIHDPRAKDMIIARLNNPNFTSLIAQFGSGEGNSYYMFNIACQPEMPVETIAARLVEPEISYFLITCPNYFQPVASMYTENPCLSTGQALSKIEEMVCKDGSDVEETLEKMEILAKLQKVSLKDIALRNLNELAKYFDNYAALIKFTKRLEMTEEVAMKMMEACRYPGQFVRLFFKLLPQCAELPIEFYRETLIATGPYLSTRERERLLSAVDECGSINHLIIDRGKVAELATSLDHEAGRTIVMEVMGLKYGIDPNGLTNRYTSVAVPATSIHISAWNQRLIERGFSGEQVELCQRVRQLAYGAVYDGSDAGFPPQWRQRFDNLFQWLKTSGILEQMGPSAGRFYIYHPMVQKFRVIPPFRNIWAGKVLEYFENAVIEKGPADHNMESVVGDALALFEEGAKKYIYIQQEILPALEEMNEYLKPHILDKGVWFSGRDSIPLYMAVKAAHFGANLDGSKIHERIKIAYISRLVFENAQSPKQLSEVKTYLARLGIKPDMLAVDTGYEGSVIKKAQQLLGGKKPNRIALLQASSISGVRQILQNPKHIVGAIEGLPKPFDRTIEIRDGKPFHLPYCADVVLLSWVINHAIVRHFVPKVEHYAED